jgi:potassium voltage-gated channel Shab-related subfamily B protein 1
MVGERDRDHDAVRWEIGDRTITTPPPFNNNGAPQFSPLQQQQLHQQHSQLSFTGGGGRVGSAANMCTGGLPNQAVQANRWDDDQANFGTGAKEVRYAPFPVSSPTHGLPNGPESQAPLQRAHSRY